MITQKKHTGKMPKTLFLAKMTVLKGGPIDDKKPWLVKVKRLMKSR